jgi:hypothetical protein
LAAIIPFIFPECCAIAIGRTRTAMRTNRVARSPRNANSVVHPLKGLRTGNVTQSGPQRIHKGRAQVATRKVSRKAHRLGRGAGGRPAAARLSLSRPADASSRSLPRHLDSLSRRAHDQEERESHDSGCCLPVTRMLRTQCGAPPHCGWGARLSRQPLSTPLERRDGHASQGVPLSTHLERGVPLREACPPKGAPLKTTGRRRASTN